MRALVVLCAALVFASLSHAAPAGRLRVALLPPDGAAASTLAPRLRIDPRSEVVADAGAADVLWLLPEAGAAELAAARAARARGAGLVVVAAPGQHLGALGVRAAPAQPAEGAGDLVACAEQRPGRLLRWLTTTEARTYLGRLVAWRSAPKLRAWVAIDGPGEVAVEVGGAAVVREGERLVLLGLRPTDPANEALLRWGYFNYLLHAASFVAAERAPEAFWTWPAAPVPQRGARTAWVLFLLAIWPLSLGAFLWARRAARRSGDALLERFFTALQDQHRGRGADAPSPWARVGFERPLGGFFVLTGALLVFLAPYIFVVQFLLPTYVQQFPEVDGMWSSVYEFFLWVWTFFDMGTSVAFVKFFAELRTKDPKEALSAVQFYSWWQILTGAVQVTVVGLIGVFYVPRTEYALFSHLVALYALSQWPGFFFTLAFFFQAVQRYDYYQAIDLLQNRFLVVVGPIPFILFGRAWGREHAEYGEALGAIFGTAVGYYVVGLLVLGLSYGLYRRLGVGLKPLFLASFGWPTTRRMLSYGWKVMLSGLMHKAAVAIEVTVLVMLLYSYNEAMGIRSLIDYRFYFLFIFIYGWFEPAVASFSEAHGAGKLQLLRYYIARYFQYGHLYCAILFSFIVPLGPPFIRGALDPRWAAAAPLLLVACLRGLLLPAAWIIDSVQKGCGRPGLNALLLVVEQVLRLALFWVLVPRYQLGGVLGAMLLTLGLKAVVGWAMIDHAIVRLTLPAWPSVLAPLGAGAINWALWATVARLCEGAPRPVLLAVMLVGGVLSFPLCFFLCGLLGGLDERALRELEAGAIMSSVLRPVAAVLLGAGRAGARRQIFRPTFPEGLAQDAEREAREIEAAADAAAHHAR